MRSASKLDPFVVKNILRINQTETHCKLCGMKSHGQTSPSRIAMHIYAKHMDDTQRPFQCHICAKGFAREATLGYHMEMHEDKRAHKCSFCQKGFNTTANRNSHEREVHLKIKKGTVAKSVRGSGCRKVPEETPEQRRERWNKCVFEKMEKNNQDLE